MFRPDGLSDFGALRTKAGGARACLVAFDLLNLDGDQAAREPAWSPSISSTSTARIFVSIRSRSGAGRSCGLSTGPTVSCSARRSRPRARSCSPRPASWAWRGSCRSAPAVGIGAGRHNDLQGGDFRAGSRCRARPGLRGRRDDDQRARIRQRHGHITRDGDAAREFVHQIQVGMVGINVPIPVPMAFHSFGGWKASLFGDHVCDLICAEPLELEGFNPHTPIPSEALQPAIGIVIAELPPRRQQDADVGRQRGWQDRRVKTAFERLINAVDNNKCSRLPV